MELETQIPTLTLYKEESYFDQNSPDNRVTNATEYFPYRKGHSSITDTTDTPITLNTLNSLKSDDEDNEDEDIDDKSETEFMDDEEHEATMRKLYHPAPKTKTKTQNSYSKTDKSISPELLRMSDSTAPPSFNPSFPNPNLRVNVKEEDTMSAISAISGYHDMNHRMRPHIIDNNTEMTESRISASFNFDFADAQRKYSKQQHLNVNEDRDEVDTASDKFATGFIGDDDDDEEEDMDEGDHEEEEETTRRTRETIKTDDSKSKYSTVNRNKSSKSKESFSFSSRHKHMQHTAKYREYRIKDEPRALSNSNTNANSKPVSITISRTNSEGSITNYNMSDLDPNYEDLPLQLVNTCSSSRPVPIIRRVAIQKSIQQTNGHNNVQKNKEMEKDKKTETAEEHEEDEEVEEEHDNIHRLFATFPQPRYLSVSVSESTEQTEFGYNDNPNRSRYNYQTNLIAQPRASKIEKTEYTEFNTNKAKQPKQKCKAKSKLKSSSKTKRKPKPKLTLKHSKYKTQNGSRASKKAMQLKQKQRTKKKLELERARSHNHNKHHFNNAPLHHYNHYSPKRQQYTYYNTPPTPTPNESPQSKTKAKTRPLTMRCVSSNTNTNSCASFTSQFSFDSSHDDENIQRELEQIINHFWRVIDIASNKKIPFEILKISLRVKSIAIQENNWDILLNELTNFQPSKNITLTMFKDFIFNRRPQNTQYHHRHSHIVKMLRKQLVVGLLETDDRKQPKLSKTHYVRYEQEDEHEEDEYYSKMKTIKFHIMPTTNKSNTESKPKLNSKSKHKRSFSGYDEAKSIDTLQEFGGKNLNYFVQTESKNANKKNKNKYKSKKTKNKNKRKPKKMKTDSYGGRARSSSHHSYLQSMRSSITSYQSHQNASEYVKYTVQQSIVSSLLECLQNESLNKLHSSRIRSYSYRNEWRKSLKYLLRCYFAHVSDNQDVFTLEQFKFALYDECNIRYEFSHHILPILKLNSDDCTQQYVITEHSFVEWMLKHMDQMMNLRATQSLKDRHLDKLLKIISYHDRKPKKKKENPFIAIAPPITPNQANESNISATTSEEDMNRNKLRLLKAKSMNAMSRNVHDTPTTDITATTATTATTTNTDSTCSHIRRPYKRKDQLNADNNHLHAHLHHHHASRHHYSTSHGVDYVYHYK